MLNWGDYANDAEGKTRLDTMRAGFFCDCHDGYGCFLITAFENTSTTGSI
jgi:hypothetical protein